MINMNLKNHYKKVWPLTMLVAILVLVIVVCREKNDNVIVDGIAQEKCIEDTAALHIEEETRIISIQQDEIEKDSSNASNYVTSIKYTLDAVRVRRFPSFDSEVIAVYEPGTEVNYINKVDDDWSSIMYEGDVCYIATEYLTDDKDWKSKIQTRNGYKDGDEIKLNPNWKFANYSEISTGSASIYLANSNRKNIVIGINAGHGTEGGTNKKTWCHPDQTEKVTGGTTAAGAVKAVAVSTGMTFADGTPESKITLKEALIVKEMLLDNGYDVLMIRESDDVQLDNVARTVICNNVADCHIAIHWDGDGLDYDKGCFYMSVPDGIKYLDSVASAWKESERLGNSIITGLRDNGNKIMGDGNMDMDLTQTSYSTIPSIDIELGNQSSDYCDDNLRKLAKGIEDGIDMYFNQ